MRRLAAALALVVLLHAPGAAAEPQLVALELLLAVDSSSSVSDAEFDLQMEGIARGFEDERVLAAIQDIGPAGIAVALMQWSSLTSQVLAVDWTHIAGAAEARAFATRVRGTARFVTGGATAMSTALTEAMASIEANGFEGQRRAIDVSGDGRANEGESPAIVRDEAIRAGITINGLAILNEEPAVAAYYQSWVIGGPGSFLLTALDYEDFAEAMRRKLYQEILGPPIAGRPSRGGLAASH